MKHHTLTTVLLSQDDLALMRQGRMLSVTTPSGEEVLFGWDKAATNGASNKQRRFTPEFHAGVVAYAKAHPNLTTAAIARHFKVSAPSVREWIAAASKKK